MEPVAARCLTGPNLYAPGPAAVAELELGPGEERAAALAAISRELQALAAALGVPAPALLHRGYGGRGLAIAVEAPRADLEVAAATLERAIARAQAGAQEPLEADVAAIRAIAAESANPALDALVAAADARGLPTLVDDEALTIGLGARGMTWPLEQLPEAGAIPWASLGAVPIALVTGTNGKTTSARLLARIARRAGFHVGNTSTDGIAIDEVVIDEGDWTGPGATRLLLRRPEVELAVLEVARGGLLRRGLAIQRAQAALITNVSADHLGEYGIDDLQTMAQVKAIVGGVVEPGGRVVLGADSPPLTRIDTGRFAAPIVYFALSPDNPTLAAHRRAGGEAWYVAEGVIVEAAGGRESPLCAVRELPFTFGGAAAYNVQNALGAAACARALGLERAAIIDGLRSFASSAAENPGRINRFDLDGVGLVLDFAHNPAGVDAIAGVLAALRGSGRLAIAIGMAGDRRDEDLDELVRALLDLRPDRVILREQPDYLRGRKLGEVPAVLRRALIARGLDPAAIVEAEDEVASIEGARAWARPGDLIVVLTHTQRGPVNALLARRARAL